MRNETRFWMLIPVLENLGGKGTLHRVGWGDNTSGNSIRGILEWGTSHNSKYM